MEEAQTFSTDQSVSAPNLLRAAMEGDGEAFGLLVDPYIPAALAGAELILGSQADASDAVQDALLSAWRGLRGLREPDKFSAWFRKLVVRSALKLAGRRTRSRILQLDPVSADQGRDTLELALQSSQLERAFDRLETKDRVIIMLHRARLPGRGTSPSHPRRLGLHCHR